MHTPLMQISGIKVIVPQCFYFKCIRCVIVDTSVNTNGAISSLLLKNTVWVLYLALQWLKLPGGMRSRCLFMKRGSGDTRVLVESASSERRIAHPEAEETGRASCHGPSGLPDPALSHPGRRVEHPARVSGGSLMKFST